MRVVLFLGNPYQILSQPVMNSLSSSPVPCKQQYSYIYLEWYVCIVYRACHKLSKVKPAQFLLLSVVLILVVNLIMGGSPTIHLHVNNAFSKGSCYNSEIRSTGKQSIKATKQQHQLPSDSLLPTRRAVVIGKTPRPEHVLTQILQNRTRARGSNSGVAVVKAWRSCLPIIYCGGPAPGSALLLHLLPPRSRRHFFS